jgi:hypothetical protein
MATWEGLRSYIKSKYAVAEDQFEFLMLGFSMDDGRTQKVIVRRLRLGSDEWAEIASPVCPVGSIDPLEALRSNGQVVVGGLALADWDENLIVFRHSLPIKDLDLDEFEVPFQIVVSLADRFEQQFTGADTY